MEHGSPARRSPPSARVTAVLGALADAAPAQRSLAEVARATSLSASTCLGILNELAAGDWVVRHRPGPTYSLGPAAVVVGQAAQRSYPARVGLSDLADELGLVCTAASVVGRHIVVLDRSGPPGGPAVAPGTRFPFVAPIGVMFAAWQPDAVMKQWLDNAVVALDDERVQRTLEVVETCRSLGWMAERLTEAERTLHELLPGFDGSSGTDAVWRALAQATDIFGYRDYVRDELRSGRCSVSVVAAPTFDRDGRPDVFLSAYVMERSITVTHLRSVATKVRAACDEITAAAGGHDPWLSRR